MPNAVDYLVKPLIEYAREVEKQTGYQPKIEVTLDTAVFLELAQWPMVRPGGFTLAPIEIFDGITIKPPEPDMVSTTVTYRDLDGKTLHSATVDASGRASVTVLDDVDLGPSMADLADVGAELFDRFQSLAAEVIPNGTWRDQPQHVRDGVCILLKMAGNRTHGILVEETRSLPIEGPPLTGTCSSCGADLDALARTGVTSHICFGPGDSTNHREPS